MGIYFTFAGMFGSLLIVFALLILYKKYKLSSLIIALISFIANRVIPYRDFFYEPTELVSFETKDIFKYMYIQDTTWFIFSMAILIFTLQIKNKNL